MPNLKPGEFFRPIRRLKWRSGFISLIGLLLAASISVQPAPARTDRQPLAIRLADGREVVFRVELAADPGSRRRGLMFRAELPADAGMLFDYGHERPVHMWMKNTRIPLDMLFIAGDGRIVHVVENTEPGSERLIESTRPVRAVLEINAGSVQKHGIGPGDRILHPIFTEGRSAD